MSGFAAYVPRSSPAHRWPAGLKLLALAGVGGAVFFIQPLWLLALLLAALLPLWRLARLPWRTLVRQGALALPLALLAFGVQLWLGDAETGALVALRYLLVVLAAAWVAGCTRVSDSIAALEAGLAPLRRLRLDPEKLALALSLTVRFLPLLAEEARAIHEAQAARGREKYWLALALPLLVRALILADAMTDAIEARIGANPGAD